MCGHRRDGGSAPPSYAENFCGEVSSPEPSTSPFTRSPRRRGRARSVVLQTERTGGRDVDDQLELARLTTGKSAGLTPLSMRPVRRRPDETHPPNLSRSSLGRRPPRTRARYRWRAERCVPLAWQAGPAGWKKSGSVPTISASAWSPYQRRERLLDLAAIGRPNDLDLDADRGSRRRQVFGEVLGILVAWS